MPNLPEQAFHAERARLVDEDRHRARAEVLVAQQLREEAHEGLRRRDLAALDGRLEHGVEGLERRHLELLVGLGAAMRQVAAERLATLVQVAHLRRVLFRLIERDVAEMLVGDRNVPAVAEQLHVLVDQLLGLVRGVLALAALAHAEALDGLHQEHRRLAFVVRGLVERGVDLLRVVAAALQAPDVLVAHVGDRGEQLRVLPEEVLAHEGAVVGLHRLVVAVDGLHHHATQRAVLVAREQRIPVAAPDQLDDVPARAAELALELLDDLAVAAHRPVEALQVAVDDEDQVVELLARGQSDRAERLGLVHLAVAAKDPDLALARVGDAARVQVLEEARLVDRHQRAESHRDGRELPELGHQLRVRVARDALAVDLLAKVEQLLFGQPSFHEGACVDAGRRVALDVEQVTAVIGPTRRARND